MRKQIFFALCVFSVLGNAAAGHAASFEKASREMNRENWREARKQYSALIRKGTSGGRAAQSEAYLGLARTYFYEKDFQGVIRSLDSIESRIPENKNGMWMHLLLYRSAMVVGQTDVATRHYQALLRLRQEFSLPEIADYLAILKKLGGMSKTAFVLTDSVTDTSRQNGFFLAESLMGLEITRGAERLWMMLIAGRPDDLSRQALLRLGQSLDWEGDGSEAGRYLKLFVLLFPEDSRAADALYRLGKWSHATGAPDAAVPYTLVADYYPATLYGASAVIDRAWTWPSRELVRLALQAVRESPGLPDPVLERGLGLALSYPDWLEKESDLEWAARRYRAFFPLGPFAEKAVAGKNKGEPLK